MAKRSTILPKGKITRQLQRQATFEAVLADMKQRFTGKRSIMRAMARAKANNEVRLANAHLNVAPATAS